MIVQLLCVSNDHYQSSSLAATNMIITLCFLLHHVTAQDLNVNIFSLCTEFDLCTSHFDLVIIVDF